MYRPTPTGLALRERMLLLISILFYYSSDWQRPAGPEEAKLRPLSEDPQPLRPGEYRSEEFEPSLPFRAGKGWSGTPLKASDHLEITRRETARSGFANIQEVYEPTGTSSPNVVDAPKD